MGSCSKMNVFLRYGSHAEKEYFEKMLRSFDGVVFSGNLIESTPAATASLIIKHCGAQSSTKYIIDPMTYSFGEYVTPRSGKINSQLDWLKSKTRRNGIQIKSSYKKLSKALGSVFAKAVETSSAIKIEDLEDSNKRKSICKSTIEYQTKRIKNILTEDEEYASLIDNLSGPAIVYMPYFYFDEHRKDRWIEIQKNIITDSKEISNDLFLKLCFSKSLLKDEDFLNNLIALPVQGIRGVCLWASNFNEKTADVESLKGFCKLVEGFARNKIEVFNRHGGYFSYLLSKKGITIVSHGVGYGSQKDVMPVMGGGTPTVNFYYPELHGNFGVPKIERIFNNIGVKTPINFFEKICDCVICKGVIRDDLGNFEDFGETHLATKSSTRKTQTPGAAKRARFHYLLCKVNEKKLVDSSELPQLMKELEQAKGTASFPVFEAEGKYIERWLEALSDPF